MKFHRFFNPCYDDGFLVKRIKEIIDLQKPDIIHIFGTETMYGLVSSQTDVPVIIHIQGILFPYLNAYFPAGYSKSDLSSIMEKRAFKMNSFFADRELKILRSCRYYMGRTVWDKRVVEILSPGSTYFRCEELLRPEFYSLKPISRKSCRNKIKLISVLSSPIYKGHDMILKTANILQKFLNIEFSWTVIGYHSMEKAEKKFGLNASELNIQMVGRKDVDEVIHLLQESDIFIHPSYIDNSPNSVCEAQYIGLPVIACNEGGVPSLIEHRKTGILVPCNDPYTAASYIKELQRDDTLYSEISRNEIELAARRHNPKTVVETLIRIYEQVINQ